MSRSEISFERVPPEEISNGLEGVTVIRPVIRSKTDAKRVLWLCAQVEESWKGYNTAEGFILNADYRRARAIYDGLANPEPGQPKRHDWDGRIKPLALELANAMRRPINKAQLRRMIIDQYREKYGLHLSDSETFKTNLRNWLKETGF